MVRVGHKELGYESWEQLWADYVVITTVRNPYDRAGSAYDYILWHRKWRQSQEKVRTSLAALNRSRFFASVPCTLA